MIHVVPPLELGGVGWGRGESNPNWQNMSACLHAVECARECVFVCLYSGVGRKIENRNHKKVMLLPIFSTGIDTWELMFPPILL